MKNILILGANGYCGSKLRPYLESKGYKITSTDITGQGQHTDVRNSDGIKELMEGQNAVIHLACLSNDPSAELNPTLTKSINLDSFYPTVTAARDAGVKRFLFASSSSVYGVKKEQNVTEDLPLKPLTDYSRFKAECEKILFANKGDMEGVIIRPATVCGMSPNLRLDLCVHILTISALRHGVIKVFGGSQYRPNIHIDDLVDAYQIVLEKGRDGEVYNVGYQNLTIMETAEMVRNVVGGHVTIEETQTDDLRSYHVSSDKIANELGYRPWRPIGQAIMEIKEAWETGQIGDPDDIKYHRKKWVKEMLHG